jgi:hypothetical protein
MGQSYPQVPSGGTGVMGSLAAAGFGGVSGGTG